MTSIPEADLLAGFALYDETAARLKMFNAECEAEVEDRRRREGGPCSCPDCRLARERPSSEQVEHGARCGVHDRFDLSGE